MSENLLYGIAIILMIAIMLFSTAIIGQPVEKKKYAPTPACAPETSSFRKI